MNELPAGPRVWTERQDLTSQRNGLHALDVGDDRICVDHGWPARPDSQALARIRTSACRGWETSSGAHRTP